MRNKLITVLLGIVALLGGYQISNLGSVASVDSYYSTTTEATGWTANTAKVVYTGSGVLGSVNITLASATSLNIYDATTTDLTKRTGNKATSTILLAKMGTSVTAGTYTFDSIFSNGLIIEPIGTLIASSTVTWKGL